MKKIVAFYGATLLALLVLSASQSLSQTQTVAATVSTSTSSVAPAASASRIDVPALLHPDPWEYGVFLDGGFGTHSHPGTDYHFFNAGVRLGKVLTGAAGPGILHGQFEYAVDAMPYWQVFTPKEVVSVTTGNPPQTVQYHTGGSFSGFSVTPIILRWNLVHWHRVLPWIQGAGGLIWTNHKFPPIATSVWNFSPQFGIGFHYFLKPNRAITFAGNAEHISSASLGDKNPGVNASVQFQIGYTWWK